MSFRAEYGAPGSCHGVSIHHLRATLARSWSAAVLPWSPGAVLPDVSPPGIFLDCVRTHLLPEDPLRLESNPARSHIEPLGPADHTLCSVLSGTVLEIRGQDPTRGEAPESVHHSSACWHVPGELQCGPEDAWAGGSVPDVTEKENRSAPWAPLSPMGSARGSHHHRPGVCSFAGELHGSLPVSRAQTTPPECSHVPEG